MRRERRERGMKENIRKTKRGLLCIREIETTERGKRKEKKRRERDMKNTESKEEERLRLEKRETGG